MRETFLSRPAAAWFDLVRPVRGGMVRRRRAECLWRASASVDDSRIRRISGDSWLLELHASVIGNDHGDGRAGPDLSCCATGRDDLEVRPAWSGSGDGRVVGRELAVWNLRPKDALRTCVWRGSCGDRLDGVDGVLCDDRLPWCCLECRECRTV